MELSIGALLLSSLLPVREIQTWLFSLASLIAAVSSALALVLAKTALQSGWADIRFLGLTVIFATAAYGCFRLDRLALGRLLLVAAGLLGLFFGLLPVSRQIVLERGLDLRMPLYVDAGLLSAALLLGAAAVTTIVAHCYLITPRMQFAILERGIHLLLGAIALRLLVVVLTLTTFRHFDPVAAHNLAGALWSARGDLYFFLMRLFWGLAAPAVLALLALRCALAKSNQAATGLLYLVTFCALFGELFAAYLLI
jgi:hypothetical protein